MDDFCVKPLHVYGSRFTPNIHPQTSSSHPQGSARRRAWCIPLSEVLVGRRGRWQGSRPIRRFARVLAREGWLWVRVRSMFVVLGALQSARRVLGSRSRTTSGCIFRTIDLGGILHSGQRVVGKYLSPSRASGLLAQWRHAEAEARARATSSRRFVRIQPVLLCNFRTSRNPTGPKPRLRSRA